LFLPEGDFTAQVAQAGSEYLTKLSEQAPYLVGGRSTVFDPGFSYSVQGLYLRTYAKKVNYFKNDVNPKRL